MSIYLLLLLFCVSLNYVSSTPRILNVQRFDDCDCSESKKEMAIKVIWLERQIERLQKELEIMRNINLSADSTREEVSTSDYSEIRFIAEDIKESKTLKTDCYININQVAKLQPLMVTPTFTWPKYKITDDGKMIIPYGDEFILVCPNEFKMFNEKYVSAKCAGNTTVIVHDENYEYSNILCTEETIHTLTQTNESCLHYEDSKKLKISYNIFDNVNIDVFEICINSSWNDALYTKHYMNSIADYDFKADWSDKSLFKMDFDEAYDCEYQTMYISYQIRKYFHTDDKCCFSKRQLVSHRDVFPGVSQKATFSLINNAPQWSTCHSENWNELERRVRSLVKASEDGLIVWTGVVYDNAYNVNFKGGPTLQYVPSYFWKVVQDPSSKSSLAIVQVNVPDVTTEEAASKYTLCPNICEQIGWMSSTEWSKTSQGYTYCCSIEEFEKAFPFKDLFEPGNGKILVTKPGFNNLHNFIY